MEAHPDRDRVIAALREAFRHRPAPETSVQQRYQDEDPELSELETTLRHSSTRALTLPEIENLSSPPHAESAIIITMLTNKTGIDWNHLIDFTLP